MKVGNELELLKYECLLTFASYKTLMKWKLIL